MKDTKVKYTSIPVYSVTESVLVRKSESKVVVAKNNVVIGTINSSLSSEDVGQAFRNYTTKEFRTMVQAIEALDEER